MGNHNDSYTVIVIPAMRNKNVYLAEIPRADEYAAICAHIKFNGYHSVNSQYPARYNLSMYCNNRLKPQCLNSRSMDLLLKLGHLFMPAIYGPVVVAGLSPAGIDTSVPQLVIDTYIAAFNKCA